MFKREKLFRIESYVFNPAKRKRRFRCPCCSKIVGDGAVVMERMGGSTAAFHAECFDAGVNNPKSYAYAAALRAAENK